MKIYLEDSVIQPLNNQGPKTGVEITCSPVPGSAPPLEFKSFTTPLQVPRHLSLAASQPRTQAYSRYPSDQRRLGTERDSVLGEFSRQVSQVTSYPKSSRTTGNEAGSLSFSTDMAAGPKYRCSAYLLWAKYVIVSLRDASAASVCDWSRSCRTLGC